VVRHGLRIRAVWRSPATATASGASSSIVDEMQNLFEVFPGFALGVLIVSPQQV
jgi:hypothetical protein